MANNRLGRADPPPRLVRASTHLLAPLPPGARYAPRREVAWEGIFPSTFGVAVLAAPALLFDAALAALLSGVLAGMAASGLVAWMNLDLIERRNDYRLYVERPGKRVFADPC